MAQQRVTTPVGNYFPLKVHESMVEMKTFLLEEILVSGPHRLSPREKTRGYLDLLSDAVVELSSSDFVKPSGRRIVNLGKFTMTPFLWQR